jgi:hypothetical protein
MVLLAVFALGSLVCCWMWGDVSLRTKDLLTVPCVASWGSLFIPSHSGYLFPLAQCLFAIVVGGMTFEMDWLMRDAWPCGVASRLTGANSSDSIECSGRDHFCSRINCPHFSFF